MLLLVTYDIHHLVKQVIWWRQLVRILGIPLHYFLVLCLSSELHIFLDVLAVFECKINGTSKWVAKNIEWPFLEQSNDVNFQHFRHFVSLFRRKFIKLLNEFRENIFNLIFQSVTKLLILHGIPCY